MFVKCLTEGVTLKQMSFVKPLFNNCLPHQQSLPSIIGVQWIIVKALRDVQEIQQH